MRQMLGSHTESALKRRRPDPPAAIVRPPIHNTRGRDGPPRPRKQIYNGSVLLLGLLAFSVGTNLAALCVLYGAQTDEESVRSEGGRLRRTEQGRSGAAASMATAVHGAAEKRGSRKPDVGVSGGDSSAISEKRSLSDGSLSCAAHGGPSDAEAAEMIYWFGSAPSDAVFVSSYARKGEEEKFLTFEPDGGGWNNMRIAFENVVAMAHAMGRTLVLPPKKGFDHLSKKEPGQKQSNLFGYVDFIDMAALEKEHAGFNIISMEEFLRKEAFAGKLVSSSTGQVAFPPNNQTSWDGEGLVMSPLLAKYLRDVGFTPEWKPGHCMAVFPAQEESAAEMELLFQEVTKEGLSASEHPPPVDSSTKSRMREYLLRRKLCLYDGPVRDARVVHFRYDYSTGYRLLVHFYSFVFFEDWRHDLLTKRLVRDHLRFRDELQCAAARVVAAVRDRARRKDPATNPDGHFDTLHIRRGDFTSFKEFKEVPRPAGELFQYSAGELTPGSTVYIMTDEKDKSFFKPFIDAYDVCFLDDFRHLLDGVDTHFYGVIEMLIGSRGRVFFGTWYSTFSAYVNRLRGYHANKKELKGHENGEIESYYFFPLDRKMVMKRYAPVDGGWNFWMREFPAAWRGINKGLES